jgi:hypothetical protein
MMENGFVAAAHPKKDRAPWSCLDRIRRFLSPDRTKWMRQELLVWAISPCQPHRVLLLRKLVAANDATNNGFEVGICFGAFRVVDLVRTTIRHLLFKR